MTDPIRYYVGVDGGGTSCRARITDINGHILGEAKTGSANILLGADIAMASIIDAIATAATIAGLNEESYSAMSVGLALAGAEQQSAWYEFMAQPHPFGAVTLNTDAYGACLGAWGRWRWCHPNCWHRIMWDFTQGFRAARCRRARVPNLRSGRGGRHGPSPHSTNTTSP